MKTKLPIFVAVVLILMLAASAFMGIHWLPTVFTHLSSFLSGGALFAFEILCFIIGAVFLGILLSALAFPKSMAEDAIFTPKTAIRIKGISIAIFADCLLLGIAAVWLMVAGEWLIMPAMLFVALIGMMVASAIYILSDYIARAAVLKEEADLTL